MLAVTGATGQVGGRIAARIAGLGFVQRLVVRDSARAPRLPGAEIAVASSYDDAPAMRQALSGIKTLFLVSARDRFGVAHISAKNGVPPPYYDRLQQQRTAVDAQQKPPAYNTLSTFLFLTPHRMPHSYSLTMIFIPGIHSDLGHAIYIPESESIHRQCAAVCLCG